MHAKPITRSRNTRFKMVSLSGQGDIARGTYTLLETPSSMIGDASDSPHNPYYPFPNRR